MTELYAIVLCHRVCQRCGNDGHNGHRILRHGAFFDPACADVIQKKNAHLVAGNQLIGAVRALHGDTYTVCIRVGSQHQIRANLLCQLKTVLQCLEDFRIRIGRCGEIAVGIFLLGYDGDIGDAHILQNSCNRNKAGAVQRRVDQLEACGLAQTRADLTILDGLVESFLAVLTHKLDQAFFHAFREGHVFCAGQNIGLLDGIIHHRCRVVGHLAAIRAVSLVTVVFSRVMGSGHHDACVAFIIPGREAEGRYGHQLVIDTDLDAIRCQNACRIPGEGPALQTAVIADGYGLGAALSLDPVCHTLGRLTDYPDVHTVGSGAEGPAKACGTELECDGETILDGVVISLNILKLFLQIKINQVCFEPAFVIFLIHG